MPLYTERRTEAVVFEKTAFSFGVRLYQCELACMSLANHEAEGI